MLAYRISLQRSKSLLMIIHLDVQWSQTLEYTPLCFQLC